MQEVRPNNIVPRMRRAEGHRTRWQFQCGRLTRDDVHGVTESASQKCCSESSTARTFGDLIQISKLLTGSVRQVIDAEAGLCERNVVTEMWFVVCSANSNASNVKSTFFA